MYDGEINVVISNQPLYEKLAELEAEVTALNRTITTLSEEVTIKTAQIETLTAQVSELTTQVEALTAQVNALTTENSELRSQVTELQASVNALTSDLNNLISNVNTANGEVVQHPSEYLLETKSQILTALQGKGSTATTDTTFRNYASEILLLNKKGDIHTKLLLKFNENTPKEASIYDNTVTYSSGFTRSSTVKKFDGYSMKVTDTSYVTLNRCNEIPLWDYTIEFWVNIESSAANTYTAMANCLYSTISTSNYYIYMFGSYNDTSKYVYRVNTSYSHDIPRSSITNNEWHHIAYCRRNQSKYTFLDGVRLESSSSSRYAMAWTGENFIIGGNTVGYISGQSSVYYLDQFRISDVCRYTTNFTPPTEPFTV